MLERKHVFPHVIEINFQAGRLFGCNVYLVYDKEQWVLIDIGYEETVEEVIELIRQMDFPLSKCKTLIGTHADVDHIQGLAKAKQILRTSVTTHPLAAKPLADGDRVQTFAEIQPQGIDLAMPPVDVEHLVDEGDVITVGDLELQIWHTPGHTDSQLSLRLGNLLFCADNIYRDGCVGVIDAHHGSNLVDFISSLTRIRESDVEWLLPAHGPMFAKDNSMLDATIERLERYKHMADFGTCAVDWPLMDEWEQEIAEEKLPDR